MKKLCQLIEESFLQKAGQALSTAGLGLAGAGIGAIAGTAAGAAIPFAEKIFSRKAEKSSNKAQTIKESMYLNIRALKEINESAHTIFAKKLNEEERKARKEIPRPYLELALYSIKKLEQDIFNALETSCWELKEKNYNCKNIVPLWTDGSGNILVLNKKEKQLYFYDHERFSKQGLIKVDSAKLKQLCGNEIPDTILKKITN